MIGIWSVGLAAWEVIAWSTHRPTVSALSSQGVIPLRAMIWAWWIALGFHFIIYSRTDSGQRPLWGRLLSSGQGESCPDKLSG